MLRPGDFIGYLDSAAAVADKSGKNKRNARVSALANIRSVLYVIRATFVSPRDAPCSSSSMSSQT